LLWWRWLPSSSLASSSYSRIKAGVRLCSMLECPTRMRRSQSRLERTLSSLHAHLRYSWSWWSWTAPMSLMKHYLDFETVSRYNRLLGLFHLMLVGTLWPDSDWGTCPRRMCFLLYLWIMSQEGWFCRSDILSPCQYSIVIPIYPFHGHTTCELSRWVYLSRMLAYFGSKWARTL
jgi:hypothetical protein